MKNLKKPNYLQKQRISKACLNPNNFYLKSDDGKRMILISKIDEGEAIVEGKNVSAHIECNIVSSETAKGENL